MKKLDLEITTPNNDFFDWCKSSMRGYRYRVKGEYVETSYRDYSDFKNVRPSTLAKTHNFKPRTIIFVTKKQIEVQTYGIWQSFILVKNQWQEVIEIDLVNLEVFKEGKNLKRQNIHGNWYHGLLRMYGQLSGSYTNTVLFNEDWLHDAFKTHLPYINREKIEFHTEWPLSEKLEQFRQVYKHAYLIEMLQKMDMDHIVNEVLYQRIDMRILTKHRLKKYRHYLKHEYKNPHEFKLLVASDQLGFERRPNDGYTVSDIPKVRKLARLVNVDKLQRYLIKQAAKDNLDFDLSYYVDYIEMLRKMKIKITKSNAYPQNIIQAHDQTTTVFNQYLENKEQQDYLDFRKSVKKLEFENGKFEIVLPNSTKEILIEGQVLQHCVANYIPRVIKGETAILFVRKKEEIEKPFYTMEVKKGKIVQCRGYLNANYENNSEMVQLIKQFTTERLNVRG